MTEKTASIAALLLTAMMGVAPARSATVFETTELAGATTEIDAALPPAQNFDVTTAGNYTLSLTDLRTPANLQSLQAIVTHDLAIVAQATVTYPAAPALPQTVSVNFMADPGTYRVHILAIAKPGEAGGGFGVKVAPAAGGASLLDHVDVIGGQSAPDTGQSALQTNFDIAQAATYTLTLTDHSFPAALTSLQSLLLQETDSGPVIVRMGPGTFDATPGTYQLIVVAKAAAPALAGLYGVRVDGGAGTASLYASTQAVGTLQPPIDVNVAVAGQHALTLTDTNFPASLTALGTRLAQADTVLASLNAAGSANGTLAAGPAHIYIWATPAASEGVGAYNVQLASGTQQLFADNRTVDASPDPSTPAIYAFSSAAAVAAGTYQLRIDDFMIPSAFSSLRASVTQGATQVATLTTAGTSQFTLQAGTVKVLVAAAPPAGAGNALFGVTLSSTPGGTNVIESTRGVGGLFRTHTVSITKSGNYDLTLKDLEFPARLSTASLAITRGTTLVAQILGGGTVPRQQLTPGTYVLNLLGQPAAASKYGTYGLRVAESPLPPTVTLTATATSITSGQSTTLQWTSANATTCTASGGWDGAKSTSGSQLVGPLSANATFQLSCTGDGGSGNASVTVNVSAPRSGGGGGGGGATGLPLLLLLGALGSLRRQRLAV
ncbi:MAG TPA: hypothetical protein VKB34_11180 [Povalibacter sp.]|nr:hypothetical protein [Povalibacter sp.]